MGKRELVDTHRTVKGPAAGFARRPALLVALLAAVGIGAAVAIPGSRRKAPEPETPPPVEVAVERPPPAPVEDRHDPFADAAASIGRTLNPLAVVPPMCYTKTDGVSNVCWVCHTDSVRPNALDDTELQETFDFPTTATINRWANLFRDRTSEIARIPDAEALAYVRGDNYAPLREALAARGDYPGYAPDLDFQAGFDGEGFARDGSGWRAIRYKPFPGAFWPTNGSTDDVMVRLPERFRRDEAGNDSHEIYRINLAILEAAVGADPRAEDAALERRIAPVDEEIAGIDLDGDGRVAGRASRIRGLPSSYVGTARDVPVHRYLYPLGTEFLHSVRYLDPGAPGMGALRMKELRYSRKERYFAPPELAAIYAETKAAEEAERAEGEEEWPAFEGLPETGYSNDFGWRFQGFIEDARGRLRLQTEEEHLFCMGCHTGVGVTVDSSFAMPRKVPGAEGWRPQDIRGIPDVPQAGHPEPEVLEYFRRANGGDEFRGNEELLARFFPGGRLAEEEVRRGAPGGDRDLGWLLTPSPARALLLDKAYMAIVRQQSFVLGRDPVAKPLENIHRELKKKTPTGLQETGRVYRDGRLWLDWSQSR